MALTVSLRAAVSGSQTNPLDLGSGSFPVSLSGDLSFANGTGNGQADLLFSDTRTLGASASEDLDLAGVLTSAFGATITMAKVKAIFIKAAAANTNDVVISRPATNGVPLFSAASDALAIKPGGCFMWASPNAGVTVTAGTGDLITIANSAAGTGVDYSIIIVGTSV